MHGRGYPPARRFFMTDAPLSTDPLLPAALPRWLRALWPWLAAAGSGGLLTLAFPLWDQHWLCWLGLIPLVAAVWPSSVQASAKSASPAERQGKLRRALRSPGLRAAALGYVAGLVFFWSVFSWLTTVTPPGWFALAWYLAFYFAFWAWLIARLIAAFDGWFGAETAPAPVLAEVVPPAPQPRRRTGYAPPPPPRGLLLSGLFSLRGISGGPAMRNWVLRSRWNLLFAALGASAWVAQEWVRGWLFSGFGWNELGAALHGDVALIQLAEYTGVGGLSFLAAFANLIGALTVRRFALELRHGRVRPHFDFTLTLAGLLGAFAFGFSQLPWSDRARQLSSAGETPLKVACVQAAIPQDQKWDPEFEQHIFRTYHGLTEVALASNPQLLIWPEAATPQGVLGERANFEFVMSFVERGGFNFLLGTVDRLAAAEEAKTPPSQASARDFNAALLFTADRNPEPQLYYKLHLVPFGEFIPFRNSFPLFAWIAGDQVPADFEAGRVPVVFETQNPTVRIAPLICFEDTLGELVRRFVQPQPDGKPGAQVLVDLTNDAWFQRSAGSKQHVAEAVFRTVETRRPMVRCANTGVTCFIDKFGRVPAGQILRNGENDTFGPGVLVRVIDVPRVDAPPTFYVRHGDLFAKVCVAVTVLTLLWTFLRPRRSEEMQNAERGTQSEKAEGELAFR